MATAALAALVADLRQIFSDRLDAVVAYGQRRQGPQPILALVRTLGIDDLNGCASRLRGWHKGGAATPLILTTIDFERSLDAFPIEYGEILETRRMVFGVDPFAGLTIKTEDLRRECETLVKSHLVHLRENYVECEGRPSHVGALVAEAAPHFALILRRLARLDGAPAATNADLGAYAARRPRLDARVVGDVLALAGNHAAGVDAIRIYPASLAAVEQLWRFIDGWRKE